MEANETVPVNLTKVLSNELIAVSNWRGKHLQQDQVIQGE
jgi:hypothetical protein